MASVAAEGAAVDEQQDQSQETRPAPASPPGRATVGTGGRALLVYASRHGSTREIADAVAAELGSAFAEVDVREAKAAPPPAGYDAVVVGGPMIMGWHRHAERWVKKHREQLAGVPFALFVTAAALTEDGMTAFQGVPVAKDTWLVKQPHNADKLTRKERYALPSHYLGDIAKACAPARPRTVAFFAGSLDLTTMNILEKAFVLLVVGATPGDGRHWDFVREWAAEAAGELSAG
jgi:menaquinone-dependent protoporphyrinogen oxidase